MFYDNLKNICDKEGIKITPLVLECGGTKGMLSGWKNGAAPNSDIVMKLSVRLKVPTDVLLFGKNTAVLLSNDEYKLIEMFKKVDTIDKIRIMERAETLMEQAEAARREKERIAEEKRKKIISFTSSEANEMDEEYVSIPLYDTCVSAGTGIDIDYTSSDPIQVSSDKFDDTDFAVRVSGDSMEPRYSDGDIVIVEPTPAVDQGEVGIFILNGQAYIKKLGDCCLISLNNSYEPIKINDYDSIYCQGRVIGVIPHK